MSFCFRKTPSKATALVPGPVVSAKRIFANVRHPMEEAKARNTKTRAARGPPSPFFPGILLSGHTGGPVIVDFWRGSLKETPVIQWMMIEGPLFLGCFKELPKGKHPLAGTNSNEQASALIVIFCKEDTLGTLRVLSIRLNARLPGLRPSAGTAKERRVRGRTSAAGGCCCSQGLSMAPDQGNTGKMGESSF